MKVHKQKIFQGLIWKVKKKSISDFSVESQILSGINTDKHKTTVIEMAIFKDNGQGYDNWSGD